MMSNIDKHLSPDDLAAATEAGEAIQQHTVDVPLAGGEQDDPARRLTLHELTYRPEDGDFVAAAKDADLTQPEPPTPPDQPDNQ